MTALDSPVGRRTVLKGFLIAGPTLAVAIRVGFPGEADAFPTKSDEVPDVQDLTDVLILTGTPTYYDLKIEIKPDNRVYLEVPRMEVGQGVKTAIGMLVADHLDVPLESMDITLSKAEQKRGAGQLTGGSHSVRSLWDPVRLICAEMRSRLVTAASQKMGVPVTALRTEDGYVVATSGEKVSYGEVSSQARTVTPQSAPHIKTASEFKIIGRGHPREDARAIVTGTMPYALDLPVEGALPTVVALAATHGASVMSVDDSAAKAMKGVIAVTRIPGMPEFLIPEAVAVTAETFGIAKKAKNALRIKWSPGPMDQLSDAQIDELLNGIIDKVTAPDAEQMIDAKFRWPYVPHAPMEANDAVADVRSDRADVWAGSKIPLPAQRNIATTLGMKVDQVTLHVVPSGGSFGRRLFHDPLIHAAQVSQRIGKPVKLTWMREEDIKHGRTRPVSIHHVRATLRDGDVVSFEHRQACQEMDLRHGFGDIVSQYITEYNNAGASQYVFLHTQKLPYKTGTTALTMKDRPLAKPTGALRVVYSGQVGTINEIIIDELARMLGKDEVDYRMGMLDSDRARAVLEKVAHEGQWGRKLPAGVAQGIGMHDEYKSIAAYLMEIDVRGKEPRMTRCTIAVDNGFCVNPTGTASSLMGQAMDGFAFVFRAGLHVDNGATRESNFHEYKWARMFDSAPEMSCHVLPNSNVLPGGIGELGIPAASAAAANAWARATGKQPRNFPLSEFGA
ncbi:MAG TPA: molybdopterin cofactor-binding domain-containing protein [Acidimicrobiia bacterium]|nr:molybdopterin cofactor-binding domain-containing protein [Acidimicrobiia bacterium]